MDVTKPLTLLLSGLYVVSWCLAQHQFVFFPTPKTWYEAQSHCRGVCYDLATVHHMEEMQTLLSLTEGRYDDGIWIGLHGAQSHTWHWSLPDEDLYEEGERTYAGITDNGWNCAFYINRTIHSRHCAHRIKSVCFDAKKEGLEQYALGPVLSNWQAARDYCRSHHTDLASVRNAAEEQIIQNMTLGLNAYIGAFRDSWAWSDGTYSSMRYWKPAQPVYSYPGQESCVAMLKNKTGKWGERLCGEELPFLCSCEQGSGKRFSKVRIFLKDPGLDPRDPAVQDDLLKQVKKQLSQTVASHIQLRWEKRPDGKVFFKMNP